MLKTFATSMRLQRLSLLTFLADNHKHSSLLWDEINYGCKVYNNKGFQGLYYKNFGQVNQARVFVPVNYLFRQCQTLQLTAAHINDKSDKFYNVNVTQFLAVQIESIRVFVPEIFLLVVRNTLAYHGQNLLGL